MSSAFVSDNSNYLAVALYLQIGALLIGGTAFHGGVPMVLAVGLTAFYGGMLDLLRVFYVLTACLIPLDIYQMIWGKLGAASLFLVILAVLARGAACWFGYQVHTEHSGDAGQGGAGQYRDPEVFIPQEGEGV